MTAVSFARLPLERVEFKAAGREFSAIISTSKVDFQGDIVEPTAFTNGQRVPVLVGHNWRDLPVGSGVISTTASDARIAASFFDTAGGNEAAATVKSLGELAQFSIGFDPLDFDYETRAGQRVRVIKKLQLHEVSIVVVGASVGTGLITAPKHADLAAMKDAHEKDCPACQVVRRAEFLLERYPASR